MVQGGKKTLKSMQIYTARRCKADCQTGLALLFISVIVLLPISTLGLVVKSLGAPCREYATQIKMRVQNWRKRGWRREKIRGRTESCCFNRHVSLCGFTCSVARC